MSNLNQFIGGNIPIGGYLVALDKPANFTVNGQEFLRSGVLKAYDASYASTIATDPQLGAYGATLYPSASSGFKHIGKIGTNYVTLQSNYAFYTTDFLTYTTGTSVTSPLGLQNYGTTRAPYAVNGTSYMVLTNSTANTPFYYTATGTSFTAVGGTWTTAPVGKAIAYGNSIWCAASSLNGTAGELAYIAAANPSGTWTVGAGTNIAMTQCRGMAFGAGTFVAVGSSASATAGKIAKCTSPATWTDVTPTSGITFAASDSLDDVVFDGTYFIARKGNTAIYKSTDGATWTAATVPAFDNTFYSPVGNNATSTTGYWNTLVLAGLETDGAGTLVWLTDNSVNAAQPGPSRSIVFISTDHGMTWKQSQIASLLYSYQAANNRTVSFSGGTWLASMNSGVYTNIGASFGTPNYVGTTTNIGAGWNVRIK